MAKIASSSTKKSRGKNEETKPLLLTGSPNPQTRGELKEQGIRELAFRLYIERGRIDGKEMEDWLEAEEVLRQKGKIAA